MATTLVKLEDQLKQKVKGDKMDGKTTTKTVSTSAKPKTGPQLPGKSVARVKEVKEKGPSKMDCSREIYNRMLDKPRKEVIMEFISKCGLTTAGAATYYSIHKKSAEQ